MDRRVIRYLAMAFGISWAIAGLSALFGVRSAEDPGYILVAAIFMLGPALAGIISLRVFDRGSWQELGLRWQGTRWGFVVAALGLGASIVPATLLMIGFFGDGLGITGFGHVSISSGRMITAVAELVEKAGMPLPSAQMEMLHTIPAGVVLLLCLVAAVLAACTVNLPFMLGEELGWRGYLFQQTAHWAGVRRVLFTGLVWGLWHAPLIVMGHNYPGYPVVGIGMMVLFCVALAFLFDHVRVRSNSIWAPAVLHGVLNGSAGAMVLFAWDGHVLVGSVVGAAGLMAIASLTVLAIAVDGKYRRQLLRSAGGVDAN